MAASKTRWNLTKGPFYDCCHSREEEITVPTMLFTDKIRSLIMVGLNQTRQIVGPKKRYGAIGWRRSYFCLAPFRLSVIRHRYVLDNHLSCEDQLLYQFHLLPRVVYCHKWGLEYNPMILCNLLLSVRGLSIHVKGVYVYKFKII